MIMTPEEAHGGRSGGHVVNLIWEARLGRSAVS